jgi:hypothetical protein
VQAGSYARNATAPTRTAAPAFLNGRVSAGHRRIEREGKLGVKKVVPEREAQRLLEVDKRKKARSGEGAESALATLREIERNRSECEPADEMPPGLPAHPAGTAAPRP